MTTATPGHRPASVAPGVRGGALAVLVTGLLTGLLAVSFAESSAVWGALTGAGLVLAFFGFGALTVNTVAARLPAAALLVALLTYTLQVVLLGLVFWGLTSSGVTDRTVDPTWLGLTAIGATLGWLTAQLAGTVRARRPLYDLPPAPADERVGSAHEGRGGDGHR